MIILPVLAHFFDSFNYMTFVFLVLLPLSWIWGLIRG